MPNPTPPTRRRAREPRRRSAHIKLPAVLTAALKKVVFPGREAERRASPESGGKAERCAWSEIPGSLAAKLLAPRNDDMFFASSVLCLKRAISRTTRINR
jgi:hypothetical protein